MNKTANPDKVHAPLGAYVHTMEVPPDARWLVISGQVGVDAKGSVARGIDAQSERALRNVLACLRAGRMNRQDLVKLTIYLTDSRHVTPFREARRKVLGDECVYTSTLVIVDGLADPELLVEVEAWAAKA